jgi:hypothetical protein
MVRRPATKEPAMRDLVRPQISINGTSRESLVDQQRDVLKAFDSLITAMSHAMPHGRDYQHRPAEYNGAREAWTDRMTVIVDLQREIETHALAIQAD